MVEIHLQYVGQLRCEATHGPSGNRLETDAPVDNKGRGETFSPTDLVASAYGACMLTIMGIAAQERGWELEGATARVVKSMVVDPKRRIGQLELEIRVPGEWDERQRQVLEAAGRSCPVALSLHPDMARPLRFVWGA